MIPGVIDTSDPIPPFVGKVIRVRCIGRPGSTVPCRYDPATEETKMRNLRANRPDLFLVRTDYPLRCWT